MLNPRRQQGITWILIFSVFAFALAWGEHQAERLDPDHSELHCQLCFNLEKLATALVSSALVIASLMIARSFIAVNYAFKNAHSLAASARSPPPS
ncbi:hypothetical protein [Agarivorans sp. 1_MG-2023]|uniref:hypothetical protein n=1 Tax=Agarivorans sp. 1_MG-2023 TaxID=3062634 RepID=UPI0026E30129|nr:hypothetical protein [Agarivorans sp. 1_MG-2023]MDO6764364.1 hypothetical protein [Agarivorans sp. 1_MG-2023]